MSEFDKEKERQKLREKYERDQQKREATQRMSELLLKGATMTNRHCDTCGDPIFRYQGQEFCPTCRAPAGGDTQASVEEATPEPDAAASADGEESPPGTPENAAPTSAPAATEPGQRTGADRTTGGDGDPAAERAPSDAGYQDAPRRESAPASATPTRGDDVGRAPGGVGDLGAARDALARTLTRHAEAAERADDPRRVRDHLAVVREAAEALSALER